MSSRPSEPQPTGQLVDVGGYRLHLACQGQGSPTVVMEAAIGETGLLWSLVQPAVAKLTRACVYDRAGLGWSEASPRPRTAAETFRSLVAAGPNHVETLLAEQQAVGAIHAELAGLSSQGRLVLAQDSGHYIQLERPELVIEAINEVVAAERDQPAPDAAG